MSFSRSLSTLLCAALAATTFTGCEAPVASTPANMQDVEIKFAGAVNGAPFSCEQSYEQVGTTASTLQPVDFRFYVHDVELVKADGTAMPVALEQDGQWQTRNVALLDFENKAGSCTSGNPDTRFMIKGQVAEGNYTGLRFKLGVPFALNHADPNQAASPLNLSSMGWTWRAGKKFARLDMTTTGQPQGYFIHLGSTGCVGTGNHVPGEEEKKDEHSHEDHADHGGDKMKDMATAASGSCKNPNIVTVSLDNFNPETQTVVADLGKLLADNDINSNQIETPGGCMSSPDDADCAGIMKNFGLMDQPQRFFEVK